MFIEVEDLRDNIETVINLNLVETIEFVEVREKKVNIILIMKDNRYRWKDVQAETIDEAKRFFFDVFRNMTRRL